MKFHRPCAGNLLLVAVVLGVISVLVLWVSLIQYPQTTQGTGFNVSVVLKGLETQKGDLFSNIENKLPSIIAQGGIKGITELINIAVQKKELSFNSCHNLLHQVGHRAYLYYKGDFMKIAQSVTSRCQEAYQHGVEGEIILENNRPQPKLKDFCQAAREVDPTIQCYHGAGHGFMEKSDGDIAYSLGQCALLGDSTGVQLCYSGVFSEYGNRLAGVDGDTGLRLSGTSVNTPIPEHPLVFCQGLAAQYQEACNSQLVKLQSAPNLSESLHECMYTGYSKDTQVTCVRVSGFFYADSALASRTDVTLPPIGFLPSYLHEPLLTGILMGFTEARQSGISIDTAGFCGSLSKEDKVICYTLANT